jgi:hypothetical protein
MHIPTPNPNLSTGDVLTTLRDSGHPLREWGRAIDGTPMLAARAGGGKQPAIFITAGSHAPETAGVHAAINLLHGLHTEHEVHVLPLRDPLGFDGVDRCLSFAAGRPVSVPSHAAALEHLEANATLIWRDGDTRVFLLNDTGFMWDTPRPGAERMMTMHARLVTLNREDPAALKPLWGKRIFVMCALQGVEGTNEMQRCWHGVMSDKGEWLHLNRFFGRDDAPAEVAAVDRLMREIRPGLTCDLHEGNGRGFWMPMRKPTVNPERVFQMTRAFFDYIHSKGYPITTYEDWAATDGNVGKNYTSTWMRPEPRLPGLFWADGIARVEGYNLLDYSPLFGTSYGTEGPLEQPLYTRVDGITNGILAAISVWERGPATLTG